MMNIFYIAFIILMIISGWIYNKYTMCTNGTGGTCTEHELSFYISWLENFCFFIVIGIATFIGSQSNPGATSIASRISYLFNSDYALSSTRIPREYTQQILNRIACVASKSEVNIAIKEHFSAQKCFKVETRIKTKINNMYRYEKYNDRIFCIVCPDDIEPSPSNSKGGLMLLRITKNNSSIDYITDEQCVSIKEELYRKEISIEIDPNSEIQYEHYFWVLTSEGSVQYTTFDRFTENAKVTVVNRMNDKYLIFKIPGRNEVIKLGPNQIYVIHNDMVLPRERVEFTLLAPVTI